jgi:acetolactate synthase-1/2/3 large subunit
VKLSDYVMQFLAERRARDVFVLTGGGAMHLNDSLGLEKRLSYHCLLHEQAVAIAAEAYAKTTGSPGVVMVTTGPGGLNAITGVVGAWQDSTPIFVLSGQVKRADRSAGLGVRSMGVQEVDIVEMVRSVTKYAVTILDPARIRCELERAWWEMTHGRPGPVWIDIPLDVQGAQIDENALEGFTQPTVERAQPTQAEIDAVIAAIRKAERPVLLIGNGVRLAGALPRLGAFIDALEMPVLTTWLAIDTVPEAHRLFVGRPGGLAPRGANFTVQNSDLVLSIGARLDLVITAYSHAGFARAATKIMVDVDRAEIAKMKTTIHHPIVADAGAFIEAILARAKEVAVPRRAAWIDRCLAWKAKWPVVLPEHRHQSGPVSLYHFAEVMSEVLADNAVIVSGSSGTGIEVFLHAMHVKGSQRVLHTTALGAMGFGLPAAVGAYIAAPNRPIASVDGDGGFQMNIQELATVAHGRMPVKFFVLDNGGYASIRNSQALYFGRIVGADPSTGVAMADIGRVAEAFGIQRAAIQDSANLRGQVRSVLAIQGPVVCMVKVIPDEARAPRVSTVQKPDGSMVSRPLEDLWPFLDRDEFRAQMIVPPIDE